jgi:pimeloyl-ACP methyl ester carboxylesterase
MLRPILIIIGLAILIPLAVYWFFPRPILYWVRDRLRMRGKLTLNSVRAGDYHWPYLEGGPRGGAPLVLVHGFGGDKDNWAMLAPHLCERYHLIIPDLVGFGDNARDPAAAYDIKAQTDRLIAFLDALGIDRAHLVGNSMGGWIALQAALDHPQRLTTLTLINNAGVAGKEESDLQKLPRDGASPLVPATVHDLKNLMAFIAHKPRYIPSRFMDVAFQDRAAHNALLDKIFWTIADEVDQRPLNPRLSDVAVPTLIIWGRNDRLIHVSCVAELEAGIPVNEAVIFDDVGHVPMLEKPAATAAVMRRFLAKHGH